METRPALFRASALRRFLRPNRVAVLAIMLSALVAGGALAARVLHREAPAQVLPGQLLAADIARAAALSEGAPTVSGAYVPGDRLILYARSSLTDRARVRAWAIGQLEPFAERLSRMGSGEKLTWIIDFGPPPGQQETLVAALNRANDSTQYQYFSAAPGVSTNSVAGVPAPASPASPVATGAPPTVAPSAAPAAAIQPTAARAAPAPAPSAAPASPIQPGQGVLGTGFDEAVGVQNPWLPLSGDWLIHDGVYSQRDNSGFDYISMLALTAQTDYMLDVRLRLVDGDMGGGVIYNAPASTARPGAQAVDFDAKGGFLRFGRYDDKGAYIFEGGVKIEPAINDGQWHQLHLVTHGASSAVSLDGREISKLANKSVGGFVGLVTSKARVDFDDVLVTALAQGGDFPAAQAGARPTTTASFSDDFASGGARGWQVLAGTWQNIDGSYQQIALSGFDLGSISPFQSDHFSASVRMKRIDGDMGGGLYFNMAQRDKKNRSQMVNYTQGGRALQWGRFDDGGNFVFEGSAAVPDGGDGAWHTLLLRVNAGKATFVLDGREVKRDVPLTYPSGYVGLLASNSRVAFANARFDGE